MSGKFLLDTCFIIQWHKNQADAIDMIVSWIYSLGSVVIAVSLMPSYLVGKGLMIPTAKA